MQTFLQQIVNGLVLGSLYALVALGYTMVYGLLQLFNFAHGELFMTGAYFALFVLTTVGATTLGIGFVRGGPAAAGLPLGRCRLRPPRYGDRALRLPARSPTPLASQR